MLSEKTLLGWLKPLLPLAALLCSMGCNLARPQLHVANVDFVPLPNGRIENLTVWGNSEPLIVTLKSALGSSAQRNVQLRAISDGRAILILAQWGDPTESFFRRTWQWNPEREAYDGVEVNSDFFAIKFTLEGSDAACMMNGEEGVFDVWEWRGGWTNELGGYAEDKTLIVSKTAPESGSFTRYPGPKKDEILYVQWIDDEGTLPYVFFPAPLQFQGRVLPAAAPQQPSGSAADVRAEAIYGQRGFRIVTDPGDPTSRAGQTLPATWNLEIYRLLQTGFEDDYQIMGSGAHVFSIAIADDSSAQEHYTSSLIELVFKK